MAVQSFSLCTRSLLVVDLFLWFAIPVKVFQQVINSVDTVHDTSVCTNIKWDRPARFPNGLMTSIRYLSRCYSSRYPIYRSVSLGGGSHSDSVRVLLLLPSLDFLVIYPVNRIPQTADYMDYLTLIFRSGLETLGIRQLSLLSQYDRARA